jgi:hypothetical protein
MARELQSDAVSHINITTRYGQMSVICCPKRLVTIYTVTVICSMGFYNALHSYGDFMGYNTVYSGRWVPVFRRSILPLSFEYN